ncbi:hypothetical protein VTN96DRAFT_10435 [Rasamsonia emersonii]|uniref:Dienelactone hydrolase family protein n=1 Tax=Rasamsonia emersonii (strain ATCC 16479 / CBS 393.64 / IMI 116815) TaxID=1408163 RepID=A0A0F4YHG7_RASE3|nr:Dienelactone hydrolase family protein [Rasamsonia emersonii CBS 393.64]KKA17707.1 Dienelactone hydrolase family protein [Rasamsonia emersonii CBS 393.64]
MSCPACFSGHVHDGSLKGQITKLHGLDAYVSEPVEGKPVKGIVIIVPDAFGWEFVNNRILADHYAEKGNYKVYLPDFMKGKATPVWALEVIPKLLSGKGLLNWLLKPYYLFRTLQAVVPFMISNSFSKSWPIIESFFTAVRQNEGSNLPVGAAGFCWGGKHVVNLAHGSQTADGKPLIDAGFTGHPSLLKIPDEIEKIKIPVSFALGEKDMTLKMPQIQQIQKVVDAQPEDQKGEVKVYNGAGHGFCVRADHVLQDQEQAATEAEDQAVDWFNRHFQKLPY